MNKPLGFITLLAIIITLSGFIYATCLMGYILWQQIFITQPVELLSKPECNYELHVPCEHNHDKILHRCELDLNVCVMKIIDNK